MLDGVLDNSDRINDCLVLEVSASEMPRQDVQMRKRLI